MLTLSYCSRFVLVAVTSTMPAMTICAAWCSTQLADGGIWSPPTLAGPASALSGLFASIYFAQSDIVGRSPDDVWQVAATSKTDLYCWLLMEEIRCQRIYIYISPTIMKDMKDIERWSNCENSSLYSIAVSWSSGALHRRQRKPRVQARLDIGGKGMQCAEISHVGRQSLAAFPTLQAANICCILNIPKL